MTHEELAKAIIKLKKERNAIILAHSYQRPEVQDIADFQGDSLGLSQRAVAVKEDVIVFCGVHFMAESAAILSPQKTVLIPEYRAGCPLADMATPEQVLKMRERYPDAVVISYVNTSAAVKAESDCCCTSSNALKVIEHYKDKQIIYLPDQNLAKYAMKKLNRKIILWDGYCFVHHKKITREKVEELIEAHPGIPVIAHPECPPEILELADHITSTSGMIIYVKQSPESEFIVLTESGHKHRIKQEAPEKKCYFIEQAVCASMKLITLESVYNSLKNMQYLVTVTEDIRLRAKKALEKMLEIV
ncbi:MAG: quinolinate synthase [Candidatus Schekmanbacteria bacterium RBG_13_48_7]|uniref:Quinolinate synthase n=1 Tax=Candidatus Schekmanbacteria bacterium RBG_13_48_7 TaxID=1817878 RepID=A0A1F7RV52_9BACT|nr:MAG: quinolinate synthase [Candidatus Schekmanbacteria bacterium RBG_13_48_7]